MDRTTRSSKRHPCRATPPVRPCSLRIATPRDQPSPVEHTAKTWALLMSVSSTVVLGQEITTQPVSSFSTGVSVGGVSGLWVLANLSYAGMRAQDNKSRSWRMAAFLFGFPATLVTYFVVEEGRGRAYGVDLPRSD